MRAMTALTILTATMIPFGGCQKKSEKPTPEPVVSPKISPAYEQSLNRTVAALDKCHKLLATMKDGAEVEASAEKLRAAVKDLNDSSKELADLADPSTEEAKLIADRFGTALDNQVEKLSAEADRLQPPMERTRGGSDSTDSTAQKVKNVAKTVVERVKRKINKPKPNAVTSVRG